MEIVKNLLQYELIHQSLQEGMFNSLHDVSEGGRITSLVESSLAGGKGFILNRNVNGTNEDILKFYFNETPGQFVVSLSPEKEQDFINQYGSRAVKLGEVTGQDFMEFNINNKTINLSLNELGNAWGGSNEL